MDFNLTVLQRQLGYDDDNDHDVGESGDDDNVCCQGSKLGSNYHCFNDFFLLCWACMV